MTKIFWLIFRIPIFWTIQFRIVGLIYGASNFLTSLAGIYGSSILEIFWNNKSNNYRRPSLSAGLLSAVLTICGLWIAYKICYLRIFPSVIRGFCTFLWQKWHKNDKKVKNSGPLLFAVLVFEGISWDVTPTNSEGRLYFF